jgi:hypothetical protein
MGVPVFHLKNAPTALGDSIPTRLSFPLMRLQGSLFSYQMGELQCPEDQNVEHGPQLMFAR